MRTCIVSDILVDCIEGAPDGFLCRRCQFPPQEALVVDGSVRARPGQRENACVMPDTGDDWDARSNALGLPDGGLRRVRLVIPLTEPVA